MQYYAAENLKGFANTWEVLVFNSKQSRDNYVDERDGYNHWSGNQIDCRAIKKTEIGMYMCDHRPEPFSGECWVIDPYQRYDAQIDGYIGTIDVGRPAMHNLTRLF